MNEKHTSYDWAFGLQWLVTCAVGMLVLGMVALASMWDVGWVFDQSVGETAAWAAIGLLFGGLFALGTAIGPGLLLRSGGVDAAKWITFSVIAGAIGAAFGFTLFFSVLDPEIMPESLSGLILGLFIGLPMGIAQWLALQKGGQKANIWPVIVTIAFILGFTASINLGSEGREWISIASASLLVGTITALGMVWLLGRETNTRQQQIG